MGRPCSIDESKIRGAVNKPANELLMIEAEGSYEKATAILDKYANIRPPMKGALDKLKNVPVDIERIYPLARWELLIKRIFLTAVSTAYEKNR